MDSSSLPEDPDFYRPTSSPGDLNCPRCGGAGVLTTGIDSTKECICAFRKALRARIGDEIWTALPYLKESPLFGPPGSGIDLTKENLFIKCWWRDSRSHFRLVAACLFEVHSFQWYFKIITDERIKNVFVGNEAYAARTRKKRDDEVTLNGLPDLVGNSDLVVIRLGFLGYKNTAMAGALKESLLIRQAANKPTWIIEEPNSIFEAGHFSWSQDVSEYILSRFKTLDLVQDHDDTEDAPLRGVEGASVLQSDEGISLDSEPEPSPPPRRQVRKPAALEPTTSSTTISENDSVLGLGTSKYKKNKNRFGG